MMTVGQLEELLKTRSKHLIVMLAGDAEGNSFSLLGRTTYGTFEPGLTTVTKSQAEQLRDKKFLVLYPET